MVVTLSRIDFERATDYRDEIKAPADRVRWLVVAHRRYLMIEGSALPGSEDFRAAIGTLYPVAYTLHFALKKRGIEAPVGALQGQWWSRHEGPLTAVQFRALPGSGEPWHWRLLLPVPDEATDVDVRSAIDDVAASRKPPLIEQLRCAAWAEGEVAQIIHIGPYAEEPATIERLHAAITDAGLSLRGCHHEIYIGDPNRSAPERLRTLLRQPVA